jgi:hypothetical protein
MTLLRLRPLQAAARQWHARTGYVVSQAGTMQRRLQSKNSKVTRDPMTGELTSLPNIDVSNLSSYPFCFLVPIFDL